MELGRRGIVIQPETVRTLAEDKGVTIEVDTHARQLRFVTSTGPRSFPIAVGKPSTPTPSGNWRIKFRARNPGGVLGSRWMGLNVPSGNYGIHGTNAPASIGRAVSNGCIRMHNHDIESIYDLCPVGTPVLINRLQYGPQPDWSPPGEHAPAGPPGEGWQPVRPGPAPDSPGSDHPGNTGNWEPVRPPGSIYGQGLRRGDRGQRVAVLQQRLADSGLYSGQIDGIYGPATEEAVRQFQSRQRLAADGIATPAVLARLGL